LPTGKSKAAALGIARRRRSSDTEPSQDRAHPRQQLTQIERLRQIVVGAEFQADHLVACEAGQDGEENEDSGAAEHTCPQKL